MSALSVRGLEAGYKSVPVLRGLDFDVAEGSIMALLGANGAGKTTTLRALSGLIPSRGRIELDGEDLAPIGPAQRVRRGLAHVPQGRGTFTEFSVEENLTLGGHGVRSRSQVRSDMDEWFEAFPRLRERRRQPAGQLSGGEQQMLAIARALMARPRLLMCDEPSLGLAPAVTQALFVLLARLNAERGMAILLVEQNAHLTLRMAHEACVVEHGAIVLAGPAAELGRDPRVQSAYLGA